MSFETAPNTRRGPTILADRIGRYLTAFAAIMTVGAFVNGLLVMHGASDGRIYVEAWRTSAYLVFAGMLVIVALAPRSRPGVWELVIAQKTFLIAFSVVMSDVPEARLAGWVDFVLLVVVVSGYVLCRGWCGWQANAMESISAHRKADLAA
jgi:phosphatidylglycerophosphate synthase